MGLPHYIGIKEKDFSFTFSVGSFICMFPSVCCLKIRNYKSPWDRKLTSSWPRFLIISAY